MIVFGLVRQLRCASFSCGFAAEPNL